MLTVAKKLTQKLTTGVPNMNQAYMQPNISTKNVLCVPPKVRTFYPRHPHTSSKEEGCGYLRELSSSDICSSGKARCWGALLIPYISVHQEGRMFQGALFAPYLSGEAGCLRELSLLHICPPGGSGVSGSLPSPAPPLFRTRCPLPHALTCRPGGAGVADLA